MPQDHEILIEHRYLNFPVRDDAPLQKVRFRVNDQIIRVFEITLAQEEPDFWVFADVAMHKGQTLVTEAAGPVTIIQSDTIAGGENLYQEKHRPQFHFSSRRGWLNDPNGLVFYNGVYHLFYQHNPYGWRWGNMHWGHAISKNLVQWQELSDALSPDALGTMYSGSAVVDWHNTAGLKQGNNDTLVCFYTAAGEWVEPKVPYSQCMAFSNDQGQTWQKYEDNPVIPHIAAENRDPKVIWHQASEQWIMALYLDENKETDQQRFALFASSDLKQWQQLQEIHFPGRGECPDFFPLPLDGASENIKWVFWTADGHYLIGTFDGTTFTPETSFLKSTYNDQETGSGYAAQTWSDMPATDGRRIQIAWLVADIPAMPFNQQMGFPVELTLKTTADGPRLHSWPVKEIEVLYQEQVTPDNITLSEEPAALPTDNHDLLDIDTTIEVGDAAEIELNLRGIPLVYQVNRQELSYGQRTAPLKTIAGQIHLRILLDRTSLEIFAEDGLVYIPYSVIPADDNQTCFLQARGGTSQVKEITLTKLHSAWASDKQRQA
ncbi:glycoside hydrolase family 32 protein [Chloroflexota bacterium]